MSENESGRRVFRCVLFLVLLSVSWLTMSYSALSISVNSERSVHLGLLETTIKDLMARQAEAKARKDSNRDSAGVNETKFELDSIKCQISVKSEEKLAVIGHIGYGMKGGDLVGSCVTQGDYGSETVKYCNPHQIDCNSKGNGGDKGKGGGKAGLIDADANCGVGASCGADANCKSGANGSGGKCNDRVGDVTCSILCMIAPSLACFEKNDSENNNVFIGVSTGLFSSPGVVITRTECESMRPSSA